MEKKVQILSAIIWVTLLAVVSGAEVKGAFDSPPDAVRPGVYWYFMDGNMDPELMKVDLDAMYEAGLRKALFLEVNIRVPRGPVDFMGEQWQDNVANAIKHADQLGLEFIIGTGPGWAGSGGPWIKPEQSMQHLCSGSVQIKEPGSTKIELPVPKPLRRGSMSKVTDLWHDDVARVTLNGKTLGTVWSEPCRVSIPTGLLRSTGNQLKIDVANVWQNRLLGDWKEPDDREARTLQWENGMLEGKAYPTGRYTFSTMKVTKGRLLPSGLLGPVQILTVKK